MWQNPDPHPCRPWDPTPGVSLIADLKEEPSSCHAPLAIALTTLDNNRGMAGWFLIFVVR